MEYVAAGGGAIFAAADHGVEGIGDALRGLAGDCDPVVAKDGRELTREKKVERGMAGGEFADFDFINRLLKLGVEIVNPELVEVAQHDVGRAMGHEVEPVVEGLLVVLRELRAARFHLDEHAARPDEIGELGFLAGKADAVFEGATLREGVGVVAEGFKEMEEERLGFALFIALEFGGKGGELVEGAFL